MPHLRYTWDNVQAVELNWFIVSIVGVVIGSVVIALAVRQVREAEHRGINGDVRFLGITTVLAESVRVLIQFGFGLLGLTSMREPAGPGLPEGIPLFSTARLLVPILFAVQFLLIGKSLLALYVRMRLR